MLLGYALLFSCAVILSAALTALVMRLAPRLGFVDAPGHRKIHSRPIPLGGGIAIVATMGAVIGAIVLAAFFLRDNSLLARLDPDAPRHLGGVPLVFKRLAAIAGGAAALAAMGLVDDKRGLSAWTKLTVQLGVGVLLAASGVRVSLFLPWQAAGWVLTVAWLVFVMNSFNLLDNMDGLSAGVALIISMVFFVVAVVTGHVNTAVVLSVFAGAVLGFLIFNFPPARIFMGDTGSYFIGYVLATTAITFTFVPEGTTTTSLLPFALPFILFAIPVYDTISVVYIRISEGRHPFDADRRHFSHRLTDLGLNTREAVMSIYVATLATAFPAIYIHRLGPVALMGSVVQALLVLLVVAILEHAGARKKSR